MVYKIRKNKIYLLLFIVILLIPVFNYAEEVAEIKDKINEHKEQIKKIDEEIAKYEKELRRVSTQKKTLSNLVSQLNLSHKKVLLKTKKTKQQISNTQKSILKLKKDLKQKEEYIIDNKQALKNALKHLYMKDQESPIELFLRHNTFSTAWTELENLTKFQSSVTINLDDLKQKKDELTKTIEKLTGEKLKLNKYTKELETEKRTLEISKSEKERILKITKNKETKYQAILRQKRLARQQFEKALQNYESKLKFTGNPSSIPAIGSAILSWPLNYIHITQYFGNTPYAKAGAYNGKGHNGIDLGTPIGSPVMAPADGVVTATGNTDAFRGCLSYGKWVLINHQNGLSTMYGHLSKILVSPGQHLKRGEVFAHSGTTGYSTGPHLHFGVYATNGVKVVRIGSIHKSKHCTNARIPVAPWSAYLNPLNYLPSRH